jgi:hypothetical protein
LKSKRGSATGDGSGISFLPTPEPSDLIADIINYVQIADPHQDANVYCFGVKLSGREENPRRFDLREVGITGIGV